MLKVFTFVVIAISVTMATTRNCKPFNTGNNLYIYKTYKNVRKHLEIAIFKCKKGYYRSGPQTRRCHNGTWSGKLPQCLLKRVTTTQCPKLNSIPNGRVRGNSRRVNARRRFVCRNGYIRIGPASQKCTSNLKWSGKIPRCVKDVTCRNPGRPKNGFRFGSSFKNSKTVKFGCKKDYKLVGSEFRQCMSNRKWSGKGARCKKIDPLEELKEVAKKLRQNVVDKFSLVTTDSRARSGLTSSASGLDFVFVLDHSQSVGVTNFKRGVKFAGKIIEKFGVSAKPQGTRVAVLTFHNDVNIRYNLKTNAIKDINETMKALSALQFAGGGTDIAKALGKVYHEVRPETRGDAKKVLFIITDGHSNTDTKPQGIAARLKEKGFEIFAIGITRNANEKELRSIGSQPYRSHIYLIDTYNTLEKLVDMITEDGIDEWECGEAGDTGLRSNPKTPDIKISQQDAWPWQAAVDVEGKYQCGGTLINQQWLLTSLSCFNKSRISDTTEYQVRATLGVFHRSKAKGTEQDIKVVKIIRQKKFAKRSRDDLALLQLEHKVKLSSFVRPVCLDENPDSSLIWPTQYGVITGWGSRKIPRKQPIPLHQEVHQAIVKFVSLHECKQNTKYNLGGKVFCGSSFVDDDMNAECLGDTGGPVMVRSQDESWMLVGVMKYNEGCSHEKYSVFTKVGHYSKWITKIISSA